MKIPAVAAAQYVVRPIKALGSAVMRAMQGIRNVTIPGKGARAPSHPQAGGAVTSSFRAAGGVGVARPVHQDVQTPSSCIDRRPAVGPTLSPLERERSEAEAALLDHARTGSEKLDDLVIRLHESARSGSNARWQGKLRSAGADLFEISDKLSSYLEHRDVCVLPALGEIPGKLRDLLGNRNFVEACSQLSMQWGQPADFFAARVRLVWGVLETRLRTLDDLNKRVPPPPYEFPPSYESSFAQRGGEAQR